MITAIWTIVIFCVLVFIHELGHFAVAKLAGVTVHEFSIGMGPQIFSFERGGTRYGLRLLPIGGFVQLEGEEGGSDDAGALCNKSALVRFLVFVAGAAMNLLLGFVIFLFLVGLTNIYGVNVVDSVVPDSAFSQADIRPGDKIVRAEGEYYSARIHDYNDLKYFITKNPDGGAYFTIERGEETLRKYVEPQFVEAENRYIYGFTPQALSKTPLSVIEAAYRESVFMVKLVVASLWGLVTGEVPISSLSGPVGIVDQIGEAAKMGVYNVLFLAALISINLGVFNLLPLPALDGGRVLFIIVEKIRRKPLKPEHEGMIHFIGFALLMVLILFATFSDIKRIFFG